MILSEKCHLRQTIKSTFVVLFCRSFHFLMMNVTGSLLFSLGERRHLFGLCIARNSQCFLDNMYISDKTESTDSQGSGCTQSWSGRDSRPSIKLRLRTLY